MGSPVGVQVPLPAPTSQAGEKRPSASLCSAFVAAAYHMYASFLTPSPTSHPAPFDRPGASDSDVASPLPWRRTFGIRPHGSADATLVYRSLRCQSMLTPCKRYRSRSSLVFSSMKLKPEVRMFGSSMSMPVCSLTNSGAGSSNPDRRRLWYFSTKPS
jgi:hypothetical protein